MNHIEKRTVFRLVFQPNHKFDYNYLQRSIELIFQNTDTHKSGEPKIYSRKMVTKTLWFKLCEKLVTCVSGCQNYIDNKNLLEL